MSTGYHNTRFMLTMLFDIAIFTDDKRYLLKELKLLHGLLVGARLWGS
jgi:hypothetical protein